MLISTVTVQGGKATESESTRYSDRLKSMKSKKSPPKNREIPQSDWEQTPLRVKQWVESQEKYLEELQQKLAEVQAEKQSRKRASLGDARLGE